MWLEGQGILNRICSNASARPKALEKYPSTASNWFCLPSRCASGSGYERGPYTLLPGYQANYPIPFTHVLAERRLMRLLNLRGKTLSATFGSILLLRSWHQVLPHCTDMRLDTAIASGVMALWLLAGKRLKRRVQTSINGLLTTSILYSLVGRFAFIDGTHRLA